MSQMVRLARDTGLDVLGPAGTLCRYGRDQLGEPDLEGPTAEHVKIVEMLKGLSEQGAAPRSEQSAPPSRAPRIRFKD